MSQYYPGQQSDNDIRCDTGVPTRPAPEQPLTADAPGAETSSEAAPDARPPADAAASPDEATTPAAAAPEAQDAAPSATQDEPAIPCPRKDGGLVSTDDCFYCPERKGCPAREASPSA